MATEQQLLPAIKSLVADLVSEATSDDDTPIAEYLDLAKTSPIVGSALQVITQLAVMQLGEYTHPDPDIEASIRMNLEQMRGSLALSLEELMSVFPLGYAVSQWGVEVLAGDYKLIDIQILNPADYAFEGKVGAIDNIVWRGGATDIRIPYSGEDGRIIHVVNQRHLNFREPKGVATLRRVRAAYQAWKIVIAEMVIAAQRQATPIVVGYTDSQVTITEVDALGQPVLDEFGKPKQIQAPAAMLTQLESLDNRSVLTTDIRNRIEALNQQTGGTFFMDALRLLQQLQLMGLLFPESILTATGVGDSNLNSGQRSTLGIIIESLVNQIKEVILENPVRRLITWNFGEQESYGSFPAPEQDDTDAIALLTALTNAVSSGYFSPADLAVLNRGRALAGLPPTEETPVAMGRMFSGANLDYWRLEGNGSAITH